MLIKLIIVSQVVVRFFENEDPSRIPAPSKLVLVRF